MAGTFYQRDGRITSSATDTPAMTDPTPTRAEVERDLLMAVLLGAEYRVDLDWLHKHGMEGATALGKRVAELTIAMRDERDALREWAEAAERDRDEHKAVLRMTGEMLTSARRAEAAAWNDAIEAAEAAYAHGFAAIRALRRAAPTEDR